LKNRILYYGKGSGSGGEDIFDIWTAYGHNRQDSELFKETEVKKEHGKTPESSVADRRIRRRRKY
jgi:hypothetical protein